MSAPRDTEVEIRLATVADAPAIQAIYGPVVASTHISFELEPPTPDEMAARIAGVLPAHPWIVLTEGEELLGYAYAHHYQPRAAYRWSVETSIYVSPVGVPGPQGQGRGRGALPVPARGTGQAGLPASHCGNGAAKPDEHAAAQVARLPAGGRPAQAGVETRGLARRCLVAVRAGAGHRRSRAARRRGPPPPRGPRRGPRIRAPPTRGSPRTPEGMTLKDACFLPRFRPPGPAPRPSRRPGSPDANRRTPRRPATGILLATAGPLPSGRSLRRRTCRGRSGCG